MGKTEHSCVPDIAQIDGNRKGHITLCFTYRQHDI